MASVTSESGVSILPLVGYAVLATLLAYLGLWVYRHLRSKVQSQISLPKPVSGSSHKASVFGHSTGWNWRRWTLPRVPTWSKNLKVPGVGISKAKLVANAKNLNVELLPTTALPPPPTSLPAPLPASATTPQLIDISTLPATPPLTTGSTSGSFPISPRTPSPPFMHHMSASKPLYQSPMYSSYSRSPSPLSNLATYPQKSHRRSKSLGGVPIRRLSGGSSGLRYAMEMQDFSPNHTRGTSREHLLIDFASSGSSDDDDETEGGFIKISPAASDIGILPAGKEVPPRVDARTVGRHVPLVDLDEKDVEHISPAPKIATNDDDEAWKWFASGKIPVSQPGLSLGLGLQSVSHPEELIDVSEKQRAILVAKEIPFNVRRMELEDRREEEFVNILRPKASVEPETKQGVLVDLQDNYMDDEDLPLADLSQSLNIREQKAKIAEAPRSQSPESPLVVKAAFSHPLEALVDVGPTFPIHHDVVMLPQHEIEETSTEQPSLLFQPNFLVDHHGIQESPFEAQGPFADGSFQPSDFSTESEHSRPPSLRPQIDLVDLENHPVSEVWAWDQGTAVDDPWANHASASTSNVTFSTSPTTPDTDVFVYTGMDAPMASEQLASEDLIAFEVPPTESSEVFVYDPETVVLEKSPGATLFATELADEEGEMPALDLGEGLSIVSQISSETSETEHDEPEDEEDTTPRPTPAFVELKLPALSENVIDDHVAMTEVVIPFDSENLSQVDSGLSTVDYADPDFLPLPDDSSLFKVHIPDCEPPSLLFENADASGKRSTPSQQTPTPPASPPPISPLRVFNASNGSKSTLPSPGGLSSAAEVISSLKVSPQPSLTLVIGQPPHTSTVVPLRELEDKENATPVALTSASSKSILGDKPEVVFLPTEQILENPHIQRTVLADVAPTTNVDEAGDNETTLCTTSVSMVEPEQEEEVAVARKNILHHDDEDDQLGSPLPGTFPDSGPTASDSAPTTTTSVPSTFGERLASASDVLTPFPSSRALVRSPLDIALAMQLRPGLGAGADPAWMVRFLMAMFGWFAVVVSGQAEF